MKNIPQGSREEYVMNFTHRMRILLAGMTWHAAFVLGILKPGKNKETYGFNSLEKFPYVPQLENFKEGMADIVANLKWKKHTNDFQQKLSGEISEMDRSKELYIAGDKSTNYYKVGFKEYSKHLERDITTAYSKAEREDFNNVTKDDKRIAQDLGISNRVFRTSERQAFLTYKDHKENFKNVKPSRLLNPCKQELGKVSKQILEKIVMTVRNVTGYLQFKNNISVIQWFNQIQNKQNYSFIQFDICDFYSSISKKLLSDTIEWAETMTTIGREKREIIFHVRKSFLFDGKQPWVKTKDGNFDIPMGSFDSAEVTDLVGLYLLSKLQGLGILVGLYRDDGLALSPLNPSDTDDVKKQICSIFKDHGLTVTIKANLKVVDYLDVTLDLMTGIHRPYIKPNTKPLYVHSKSNHPKSILQNIPASVNKRLSMLSSNEDVFKSSTKQHQEALEAAGYSHKLKFEEQDLNAMNKKKKRRRGRRIHWFNPPWDMNVSTKIGKKFFQVLDESFPPGHPLHKTFNRHTVKLSYSTMPNMLKKISGHNSRVTASALAEMKVVTLATDDNNTANKQQEATALPCNDCEDNCGGYLVDQIPATIPVQNEHQDEEESEECNCNGRMGPCPLDGDCMREKSCIYSCKVTRLDTGESQTYTGLAGGTFKSRFYGHNSDFNNRSNTGTKLSQHIWELKDNNVPYDIKWSILAKANTFNPVTKKCRLCLKEVYYILFKPETASLNAKSEVFGWCKHRRQWTLAES